MQLAWSQALRKAMRRRDFIKAMVGVVTAGPVAARAGQSALPVIGFLGSSWPADRARLVTAFRQGLRETGYVEGQNVAIEYRWAQDQYNQLPDLAADLVRRDVAVIVAHDTSPQLQRRSQRRRYRSSLQPGATQSRMASSPT